MDVELHLARVQQRWRYAEDDLEPGRTLRIEMLAHDFSMLPDLCHTPAGEVVDAFMNLMTPAPATAFKPGTVNGGWIEPAADDDGVLIEPPTTCEPTTREPTTH